MSIANVKVGTKLVTAFIIVALISLLVGLVGISNMSKINTEADKMYAEELLGLSFIQEANVDLIYVSEDWHDAMLSQTKDARIGKLEELKQNLGKMKENLEKARPLYNSEKDKEIFAKLDASQKEWEGMLKKVTELIPNENLARLSKEFDVASKALAPRQEVVDDIMSDLTKAKESNAAMAAKLTEELFQSSRLMMIILILAGLTLGVVIGIVISRMITRPLGQAVMVANKLAEGNLDSSMTISGTDEIGQLLSAMQNMQSRLKSIIGDDLGRVLAAVSRGDLTEQISREYPGVYGHLRNDANNTVEKLKEIINQVKESTDVIITVAREIAQGNSDLSQRTVEQAASLEETASSMEELTSTVKQNADNARQANQLAESASDIAVKGGKVVDNVVDTMSSISASSKKVVDIISVIESIAFQTNILALNAAVEAARAGEQGRGFAVVAGEVRNLAQRSAAAAKEIKNLIDDSATKVEAGSKQVDEAGTTMQEIVLAVKRVTDIMSEIAAASGEQSAGIEQVNAAVTQMDEVTQQNASLVEEAAAAAESMQGQTEALMQAVGTFRLDGGKPVASVLPSHAERKTEKPVVHTQRGIAPRPSTRVQAHAPVLEKVAPKLSGKIAHDKESDWKEF